MIRYRREVLPEPLQALVWREAEDLIIVVSAGLGAGDACIAARAAMRKLPVLVQSQLPHVTLLACA